MKLPFLLRRGWPVFTALLLILPVAGCKDDNPASPKPKPEVSMSLECSSGLIGLTVSNSGGAMQEPRLFVASFGDGHRDTLLLSLDADESITCQLSNVHGGVTVKNEDWDLEASAGDCLADYLESLLASVDLAGLIPSPLAQQNVLGCVYTIFLRNFDYDDATFELIRTEDGLTLRYVYSNIKGDLAASSPGWLCPDLTGNIAISSVVVETDIGIVEGDDPQVTLGDVEATVVGFQVNVDGTFGFIVEWITGFFMSTFTTEIGGAMEDTLNGIDLESVIIVQSSCVHRRAGRALTGLMNEAEFFPIAFH